MKIELEPGKYVIAVSGGVDSVVLLDLLRMYPGVKLTVAHFDHGIRDDSHLDLKHVEALAKRYRVPFVYDKGFLGPDVSEAEARDARYTFLRKIQSSTGAEALITAHHQDDVLETAIINLLRGTGRKGLSSLTHGEGIIRPLLDVPKSEIIDYAKRHGLTWREDSTNQDTDYLRNRVRHELLPSWSLNEKQQLLDVTKHMRHVNHEIDSELEGALSPELRRDWFILLPHTVSREVIASWLRQYGIRNFDRHTLERLTVAGKTAVPGKTIDIIKGHHMHIGKDKLALRSLDR
jgi:tRNA(Ile)-lysidine synthetase-like protein